MTPKEKSPVSDAATPQIEPMTAPSPMIEKPLPLQTKQFTRPPRISSVGAVVRVVQDYFSRLMAKADEDHLFILASAVAFDAFVCVVPAVLVLSATMGALLASEDSAVAARQTMASLLPGSAMSEEFFSLIKSSQNTGLLGVVSLIGLGIGLMGTLRVAASLIFNIKDRRTVVTGKLFDLLMTTVIGALFITTIGTTAFVTLVQSFGVKLFGITPETVDGFFRILAFLLSLGVTGLMFFLTYKYLPFHPLPNRIAFVSAVISSVSWELAKQVFDFYIRYLTNLSVVYGVYSIIVLLALWVYFSGMIFLMSAVIGQIFAERHGIAANNDPVAA